MQRQIISKCLKMSVPELLVIIGAGGHARSVADIALSCGIKEIVFWDKNARIGEKILDFSVTSDETIIKDAQSIFLAIGDNLERAEFFKILGDKNLLIKLVSKSAYMGYGTTMGKSNLVAHGAHLGPMVSVGDNNIINTHSVVEHECIIGSHNHISVNATMAGRCSIGDHVFVGAGAVIRDKISVCSNVTIGAGAIVVKNIVEPGIYVGSPAIKIR